MSDSSIPTKLLFRAGDDSFTLRTVHLSTNPLPGDVIHFDEKSWLVMDHLFIATDRDPVVDISEGRIAAWAIVRLDGEIDVQLIVVCQEVTNPQAEIISITRQAIRHLTSPAIGQRGS